MAIFNKINEKSKIISFVIGGSLLLFIIGGDILSSNSIFGFIKENVGNINGERINRSEYQKILSQVEGEYQIQTDKTPGESERQSLEFQAWSELVTKYAFSPEFEKLGLAVTEEELVEMTQGKFIHSYIKQAFGGDQNFNKENVVNFLANLDSDKMDPSIKMKWSLIQSKLPDVRLKEKYISLLKKTEYVTKEEAKRVYKEQTDKANGRYLYVPFTAINDSLVKVTDDLLEDYLSKNKEKYKVEDGRTFDYVSFKIVPSADDTLSVRKELEALVAEFKTTDNDTTFVRNNSDSKDLPKSISIGEMPDALKSLAPFAVDSVYGPVANGTKYSIFKIIDTKTDTVSSLRASHILFRIDQDKEAARKQANEILGKIRAGASFEAMAQQYGTDGTASNGGDLGWFSNTGQMVKPFEDACFGFNGKGVIPRLVETQFGFHIIKITEAKTNKKFVVAQVDKEITPQDATKDFFYNKASAFASAVKDTAAFYAELKKDLSIQKYTATNIGKNDRTITSVTGNAREIIRWSYNDASIGEVSQVFTLDDSYVVAVLLSKRDEGAASVADVKVEISQKVKNELKAQLIEEKLKTLSGDLAKMAAAYGPQALSGDANDVTLQSASLGSIGWDPISSGTLYGLAKGKRSGVIRGENGVSIVELVSTTPAPEVADYNQFKSQKEQQRSGSTDYFVDEAMKKIAKIEDYRYKFY